MLPDTVYEKLRSSVEVTSRIYGLPKVHKPLRPIMSFVISTTYKLSKYLTMILSALVGKRSSYIRTAGDFVEFICSQELTNEVMVSFDVVSLFTSVPMELAIQVTEHYLRNDPELEIRTPLTVEEIISLVKLCLKATYLQFRGSYYQQIHGTAMGSPVSVVVANLVIEEVEQRAISTLNPFFGKSM